MEIYGHRGAAGEAPENTIAGCLHAIERGVEYIEIDLRLSADNDLVVIHDKTLSRTAGVRGRVSQYRTGELSKVDARQDGPPWPRKKHCGVPTLEALLRATNKLKGYQLEVKPDSNAGIERIAQQLAERFDSASSASKVVITSSNYYLHSYLGDIAPHIRRGLVVSRADALPKIRELGCVYSAMHWSTCNPFITRQLQKNGIHISVWTVNDAQLIGNLHKMKVDSVITDYPSMAIPLRNALQR